jgi:adenylosuccinate synthase
LGKLIVVAGSQYGSEGKGHVVDHLTRPENLMGGASLVAVRVAGPNAGHVCYGACPIRCDRGPDHAFQNRYIGHPWKLRAVPVAAVSNPEAILVIADGSEVDWSVLREEIDQLDSAGYRVSDRIRISAEATLLTPDHIAQEQADEIQKRLGSTAKGIGAARAARLWRTAELYDGFRVTHDVPEFLYASLDAGKTVLIEGTQGYGLGLHAGNYPYCTSSDTRAIDFLAMAGISPWYPAVTSFEIWLATRVRPIRVAGNSGPMKEETTWQELGLPEERTTVTNKVRRVGGWDPALVRRAIRANGGDHPDSPVRLAFTMVDTILPGVTGYERYPSREDVQTREALADFIAYKENELNAPIGFIGTSPNTGFFRN